jgi:[ribosomal protein S5]-alanine N-acetyltransferase
MVLETKRLILREITPHDVDDLLEVLFDPEAMQFYPQPQNIDLISEKIFDT